MDWIVSPPNLRVEDPIPNMTVFEDQAFKKVNKVKWGHKSGGCSQPNMTCMKVCLEKVQPLLI